MHPYLQERPHYPDHIMQTMESQLGPYPSILRKMWTYLEVEGKSGTQPHTSINQLGKTNPLQKTPTLKKAADKKRRTKIPIKRQFKARLIEKSLTEPMVVTTMAASTPTAVVRPTTTTAKPSPIPERIYNLVQGKIQEIPKCTRRFQEEESPFTWNCNNPPIVQQFKAVIVATSTIPPTRDDTPWPNTIPASTNWSS